MMTSSPDRVAHRRMNTIAARLASIVVVGLVFLSVQAVFDLRSTSSELRAEAAGQASLLARLAAAELDDGLTGGASFIDEQQTAAALCQVVQPFAQQFTGVIKTLDGTPACTFGDQAVVDAMLAARGEGAPVPGPSVVEVGGEVHLLSTVANANLVSTYEISLDSLEPTGLLAERDDIIVMLLAGDRILAAWPGAGTPPGTELADTSLPAEIESGSANGRDLKGTERVFSSQPLLDGSLRVVVGLDEAVIADSLSSARRDALIQVLVGVALLFAIITFVARSIVSPIRALAGRLRNHDENELPVLPVVGPTEVRELASRFNALSEDVAASTERLAYLAHHDSLTRLYNRDRMTVEINRAIGAASATDSMMAIRIDLRSFGEVNDSYGSAVGDGVLAELGHRFRSMTDEGLVVGHLGGDDFVFVGAIRPEALAKTVDRLLATVSQPVDVDGITIECSAVAGATMLSPGSEVDQVLRELTTAVEQAKTGVESLVVHDDRMRERSLERTRMAGDLRDALHGDGIDVAFQAIVSYADGRVSSVEALARWMHPERGQIPPCEFIPVAERNGLIGELGTAVLRRSCEVAAGWHRAHPDTAPSISVNVSAHQLATRELPELVASVLRDSGLPAGGLILEVTESALIADLPTMCDRLALIRGLGVRVALDDFGTGYSSMSYLANLPVDSMKIDRTFLLEIEHDARARAIVASVIELAHSTGLVVVCEGVETTGQDDILRSLGADMVQGFLYHRPDEQTDAVLRYINERAAVPAGVLPGA